MSDPLSATASLIAVLQLSAAATKYLKDVKHGSADRMRLRDELRNATCLLEMLKDRIEDIDDSHDEVLKPASIVSLTAPDGPLHFFEKLLEELVSKLTPKDKLRKLAQPLSWPFDKKDITEMLGNLERLKTHFSLIIQNDLVALTKMSYSKLDEIGNQVENLEIKSQDDEMEKILAWISPISFRSKQADVLEGVQPGTGRWLLQDDVFLRWVNGDVAILWCPGIPGAGKTNLVALIVDHLEGQQISSRRKFAYFYCDYSQRQAQNSLALLSSLLEQVLRRKSSRTLPSEVLSLYSLHKQHGTQPTLAQITDVLKEVSSAYDALHIVVDALDECGESEESALDFISAVLSLGSNIKLLCTSRFSSIFDVFFEDNTATRLAISAQNEDIRIFLEERIRRQSRFAKHIRADPTLEEEIITTIIGESHGMFLLATLHIESLSRKTGRKEVRSSLKTLPKTLDATYKKALLRIRSQAEEDVELAEMVLFWVICARRTLTVLELQHMYAMRAFYEGEGETLEDDDIPDAEILTSGCRGLIAVDKESRLVRLVHYTAQEYFQREHQDRLPDTRTEITRICLAYLRLPNFSDGISTEDAAMSTRLEQYPFLEYAACFWGSEHVSVDYDVLWPHVIGFLSDELAVQVANQIWSLPQHRYTNWSQEFPRDVPAFVLAASFNLPNVLRRLEARGDDLEHKGSDGESPLIRAARLGLAANVALLLELGAAVDAIDSTGETALEHAVACGDADTVRVLLEGGADVSLRAASDWTLLMSAVSNDNIEVVRMLVEAGASLSEENSWRDSALSVATRNGQEAIATYLADSGAILPNSRAGRRASVIAVRKGLPQLARRLTNEYAAVARRGLERQSLAREGDLIDIPEDQEESPIGGNSSLRSTDQEVRPYDLSEALDGVNYNRGFLRRYDHVELLAKGHFAQVFLSRNKVTGVLYAVKILSPKQKGVVESIRNEIDSLTELHHQHIIRLVDIMVQDTMDTVYLVLELATEGELFNWVVMKQKLTESETRKVFSQIFSALAFMHERGWVHRDIKPENILLCDKDLSIRVADYGLAANLRDKPLNQGMCTTLCDTPSYVAPEILQPTNERMYSFPVDVWSAGVVLYICLCGFPPFSDELHTYENPYSLSQQIKVGRFDYPSPYWDSIGDPALDLIDRMLTVEVDRRATIAECLQHPWMSPESPPGDKDQETQ